MTDRTPMPPDDDARLAAMWREHSTELPPAHLDAAILAAAHREAKSRPRAADDGDALAEAREPSRWWWGLAAAATIGAIAFGVIQLAPIQPAEVPATVSDLPSPADTRLARPDGTAAQSAPVVPQPAPVVPQTAPAMPQPAPKMAKPLPATPPPEPQPPAQPTRPLPSSREAAPLQRMAPAAPAERREASPAPPSAPARARSAATDAERASALAAAPAAASIATSPDAFIERIRRALDEARPEDAERELAAFRAAYPDADERLPEPLKAWAAGQRSNGRASSKHP